MMKKLLAACVLLGACLTGPGAMAAEVTLRVHHFLGEESVPHRKVITPWAQRVEQLSKGRIRVEVHPAMTLGGKAHELVKQVEAGTVDIVWTAAAYTPGRFARTEVFGLPIVHEGDPVATNLAIHDLLPSELMFEYRGLHPLLVHVHQGHVLHMAKSEVRHVADVKGKVIRPPGRRTGRWIIEAMGAEITKKRHPKLPRALEQNKLDGALMSFQLAGSMGVIEAVKSHTLMGKDQYFGTSLYLFLMNEARYEALPEDLKQVIDTVSGRNFAREVGKVYRDAGNAAMAAAKARGNTINMLEGDEHEQMRTRMLEALSLWAKDVVTRHIDGLQLIKKARKAIRDNKVR